MMRRLVVFLGSLMLAVSVAGMSGVGAPAQARSAALVDRDCSDFSTQADAQNFFLANGGPSSDPHGLDLEGDGIACETLPCPCSYATGGGGGGGGASTGGGGGGKASPGRQSAKVIKVIDGDTVRVRLPSGARPRIELIGIAARWKTGECGIAEAKAALEGLLPKGTKVAVSGDPSQPNTLAGRPFRYVDKGRKDIGKLMLKTGWVELYVHKGKKFKRYGPYRRAAISARDNGRGLWTACPS